MPSASPRPRHAATAWSFWPSIPIRRRWKHAPRRRNSSWARGRTRGLGAGGDPELGRAAAEDDLERMPRLLRGADIVFILAGLGGGTGTGAAPVLARMARESGALVLALSRCRLNSKARAGSSRPQVRACNSSKSAADAVICLPNQKLFKLLDEKTSVLDGFKISNGLLAEGLRGIWRLLTRTGLINVDFADLCSVTRGRHAASSFATAEASGERRAEQIVEKLLSHPLLDGGQVLSEADAVLVSLVGGPDLTLVRNQQVDGAAQAPVRKRAYYFWRGHRRAVRQRLSVTVIASRRQTEETMPVAAGKAAPLHFLDKTDDARPPTRATPPPPDLTAEQKEQLIKAQNGKGRKKVSRLQKELPLEIVFKGRFDKSEPTIRHGEDLDLPTYIRRGVPLN